MTRRLAVLVFILSSCFGASVAPLFAHAGHDHKVLGTVTMAAADHVMVKDRAGKDVTVYLNADTRIRREKKSVTWSDLKAGTRVSITAAMDEGSQKMTAKSIDVAVAAATATK